MQPAPDPKPMTRNHNKEARVIASVRTPDDGHRDFAGSQATAIVPQSSSAKLAKAIDAYGNDGAGDYLERFDLPDFHRLAPGHGVLVIYESGLKRMYREWD